MTNQHRELISIILSVGIICTALFIVHRFIPSMVWAGIVVIATYPLYKIFLSGLGHRNTLAAALFTSLIGLLLLLPLTGLVGVLVKEMQLFVEYLQVIDKEGGEAPTLLSHIPLVGQELVKLWNDYISEPGSVRGLLGQLHTAMTPASHYLKSIGIDIANRSIQVGFTLMTLFFFYRDGKTISAEIERVGSYCLGSRWTRYSARLPRALRATVNGTILVGMGVGLLMGISYAWVQFPAPTLFGFLTAFAAMIPFAVPLVFAIVAVVLVAAGSFWSAVFVVSWGTFVMFVADHFVKPVMIGGAIELPFLAVLFGILGGLETLGLLGLFVGPMLMVMFMTLWYEAGAEEASV